MKIGIANDHHGVELNAQLTNYLRSIGYDVYNYGPETTEAVDYPIYAFKLGEAVARKDVDFGIVICSSGIGVSIACNKVKGVRCAKVENAEEAYYTRNDNNSNVVAFSEKLDFDEAIRIVEKFLETPFSNLERHQKRIDMITKYENGEYYDR